MLLHFLKLSLKDRIIINLETDLSHFSTFRQSLVANLTNLSRIKQLLFLVFCFTLILHFGAFLTVDYF